MAGLIPRDFIDGLLARADVVDIVSSRIQLKKAGRNYQACCPFHNEKTPSFSVSRDKQFYHCFGCGAHGNAISFIMEYDRLEFVEAIEELAKFYGVTVPREQVSRAQTSSGKAKQFDDDYSLMAQVARFFQHQLKHHANSEQVIAYLKGRGLSGDIVHKWEIGYAPPEWQALLNAFAKTPSQKQQLLDLKLVTENDQGKQYDFFRHRIMFPIRDRRGRVVGFGGRIIDGQGPKYLNSPETRVFHKGQELFGLHQARQAARQLDDVIIVEGYMDVVALSQFGINNAVAALGTATTTDHISSLLRSTKSIICCYDGDRAGREAAWRALENALPVLTDGVRMSFLFLPDGEDPDTMVRKVGLEGFQQQLLAAIPLSKFLFDHLLESHSVATPEAKLALKTAAQPLLEKVAGAGQQQMLQEQLARLVGDYDRFKLQRDMEQAERASVKPTKASAFKAEKTRISPTRMMVRLLLEYPHLAQQQSDINPHLLAQKDIGGMALLCELYDFCVDNVTAKTAQVIEHFRDSAHASVIAKLLQQEFLIAEDAAETLYKDSFVKLLDWYLEGCIETLIARSRTQTLSKDEKQQLHQLMTERKRHNKAN